MDVTNPSQPFPLKLLCLINAKFVVLAITAAITTKFVCLLQCIDCQVLLCAAEVDNTVKHKYTRCTVTGEIRAVHGMF